MASAYITYDESLVYLFVIFVLYYVGKRALQLLIQPYGPYRVKIKENREIVHMDCCLDANMLTIVYSYLDLEDLQQVKEISSNFALVDHIVRHQNPVEICHKISRKYMIYDPRFIAHLLQYKSPFLIEFFGPLKPKNRVYSMNKGTGPFNVFQVLVTVILVNIGQITEPSIFQQLEYLISVKSGWTTGPNVAKKIKGIEKLTRTLVAKYLSKYDFCIQTANVEELINSIFQPFYNNEDDFEQMKLKCFTEWALIIFLSK